MSSRASSRIEGLGTGLDKSLLGIEIETKLEDMSGYGRLPVGQTHERQDLGHCDS